MFGKPGPGEEPESQELPELPALRTFKVRRYNPEPKAEDTAIETLIVNAHGIEFNEVGALLFKQWRTMKGPDGNPAIGAFYPHIYSTYIDMEEIVEADIQASSVVLQ